MLKKLAKLKGGDGSGYEEMDGEVKQGTEPKNSPRTTDAPGEKSSSHEMSPTNGSMNTLAEDTFTIDQAIEAIGFGKFQLKLSIFTGICWMADAMEMMILSILGPALHCDWNLGHWSQAFLTTVVFAGMMVSSSIWGKICDKYGRRVSILLCAVFTFYFGLLSAFSPNYIWMLILRGLVGFGVGGVPQSVTLYAEFLPSKARAKCVVMIQFFWAIGSSLVVVVALFVMPTLGWRWLLAFASLPCLFFALACLWLPESVRYLVAMGDMEKAMATLKRVADDNGKPMPLGRLVEPTHAEGVKVKRGRMQDLFGEELRLTTILLWFIWLANAFSYYGVVLMTTELFESEDECHGGDGTNSKLAPACGLLCKDLDTKDYIDLLWTTFAEFPGLLITFSVIEYIGRKKTMAGELFMFSIFVALVAICSSRALLTFFLFAARAFISGAFQAAYVYTPEVYPTTTRAIGLGTCSGMARVGALVTPFVAQVMLEESLYATVAMYSVVCVFASIAALLLPIETKGREMQDTHIALTKLSQANIEYDVDAQ